MRAADAAVRVRDRPGPVFRRPTRRFVPIRRSPSKSLKNRGEGYNEEVVAEGGLSEDGAVSDAESEMGPEERECAQEAGDVEVARGGGGDVVPVENEAEMRGGEEVALLEEILDGFAPAADDDEVLDEGEGRGAARVEVSGAAVENATLETVELEGFAAFADWIEDGFVG